MHCCSVVAFTYFFCCFCLYAISAYVISFVCVFSLSIWHRHDFHFIHSFIKKIHFNYPYYFCAEQSARAFQFCLYTTKIYARTVATDRSHRFLLFFVVIVGVFMCIVLPPMISGLRSFTNIITKIIITYH